MWLNVSTQHFSDFILNLQWFSFHFTAIRTLFHVAPHKIPLKTKVGDEIWRSLRCWDFCKVLHACRSRLCQRGHLGWRSWSQTRLELKGTFHFFTRRPALMLDAFFEWRGTLSDFHLQNRTCCSVCSKLKRRMVMDKDINSSTKVQ